MKMVRTIFVFVLIILSGCGEIVTYPDVPVIEFLNHTTYLTTDDLGNNIALVKLNIEFTDGDGDIGIKQPSLPNLPDSLMYNLYLTMYDYKDGKFEIVEELEGTQKFRIPYISREGQNKALKGNIYVDLEYQSIIYDTIFYSFYIVDRDFHKSNVDSSDVIVLSSIEL
jgi:uncharacterized protein YceK